MFSLSPMVSLWWCWLLKLACVGLCCWPSLFTHGFMLFRLFMPYSGCTIQTLNPEQISLQSSLLIHGVSISDVTQADLQPHSIYFNFQPTLHSEVLLCPAGLVETLRFPRFPSRVPDSFSCCSVVLVSSFV